MQSLLEFLKAARGIDFTGYKRSSLERRFRRRMERVGATSFSDYVDYIEVHPAEYDELFDTLLINVTEFFRDTATWEHLRRAVLPALIDAKGADDPIRVWSAGCASGQEAFSVAMMLAETLGVAEVRERAKIYATDVDEQALDRARHAVYTAKEVESVPPDLRERYFERAEDGLAFRRDLRPAVIFGRNDLVSDAPISNLDLLICRNTLMYLNAETQGRVVRHFHLALRNGGVLVLGKSETLLSQRQLFAPVDVKKRVFSRRPHVAPPEPRMAGTTNGKGTDRPLPGDDRTARDAALDAGPTAQLIVSSTGTLTFANLAARALFGIGPEHLGRPFDEVEVASRPIDLRTPVEAALRDRRRVALDPVRFAPRDGAERMLELVIAPLGPGPAPLGVSIAVDDVTRYADLEAENEHRGSELEQAYAELHSTIDELETANEELRAANDELETMNEELESTNEELETMNQGLRSATEDVTAINDALRDCTGDLDRVNHALDAILSSLEVGVAVLDRSQRVQVWNRGAEDLWGLRPEQALEQPLLSLDVGLPSERFAPALRAVLGGTSDGEEVPLDGVNRRGRPFVCVTRIVPLAGDGDAAVRGAVVLMERADGGAGRTPAAGKGS